MKIFLLGVLLLLASTGLAEKWSGKLKTSKDFAFLHKFSYDYKKDSAICRENPNIKCPGWFKIELTAPRTMDTKNLALALYDDEEHSWPDVWHSKDSCQAKYSKSKLQLPLVWKNSTDDANSKVSVFEDEIQQGIRPRFWFFALANCGGSLDGVKYKLHTKNVFYPKWDEEFGTNEHGLNYLYLFFWLIWSGMFGAQLYSFIKLKQSLTFTHPLVRIFMVAFVLEYLCVFSLFIHYANFSNTGEGYYRLHQFGDVMEVFSRLVFIFLLLLISKGWSLSTRPFTGFWPLLLLTLCFLIGNLGALIWEESTYDSAETRIPKGVEGFQIFISICWLFMAVLYVLQIYRSHEEENITEKRSFYRKMGVIYAIWILAPPIIYFISFALDPWVRDRIIRGVSIAVITIGYGVFSFLTWHTRANKYFLIAAKPDVTMSRIANYEQL